MLTIIDSFHYCSNLDEDKRKTDYYYRRGQTEEEQEKTDSISQKVLGYASTVSGQPDLESFPCPIGKGIRFDQNFGYISLVDGEMDTIYVFSVGQNEDEAFQNAAIDYEFTAARQYEYDHRRELDEDFSKRFPVGPENTSYEDKNHAPFYYSEIALKNFRTYYDRLGTPIPESIVEYYEGLVKDTEGISLKYDYDTNAFVRKEALLAKRRREAQRSKIED